MWKKAPFAAGFIAALLSGVLIVSILALPFDDNLSRSNSDSHSEMSSSEENTAEENTAADQESSSKGSENSSAYGEESQALQAKDVEKAPEQNTLSTIKEMDAAGAPQTEIDQVFLGMLTQKKQQLEFYKSKWQNEYKQNFYALVHGSEEERLNVLYNIERLDENPRLQAYVKNVFQGGLSFEIADGETGIVPVIDYKELIGNFSPYVSDGIIKDLRSKIEMETGKR